MKLTECTILKRGIKMFDRMAFHGESFWGIINGEVKEINWLSKLRLPTDKTVQVGIDQSSSRTGITIKNDEMRFITELPREITMNVRDYREALVMQLDYFLRPLDLSHFIFEKHNRHITPLHSLINEITDEIKKYSKTRKSEGVVVKGISPTVWRSGFLLGDEYEGRFQRAQVKSACRDEVFKRYPEMKAFERYCSDDYDGFESCGIIDGYMYLNYLPNGLRRVNTSMEKKAGRRYSKEILKVNRNKIKEGIDYIMNNYANNPTIVWGNKDILIEESLNRCMDDFKEVILVITEPKEYLKLNFETGTTYSSDSVYLIYSKKLSKY